MTTLERNADIVRMATYAPLFAHIDGWQWRPDLIWFDNLRNFKSASYYVQQMYAKNKGTNVVPAKLSSPTPKGEDGLFASAVWDKDINSYIVKVTNTTNEPQQLEIKMAGLKRPPRTAQNRTRNSNEVDQENTLDKTELIVTVEGRV